MKMKQRLVSTFFAMSSLVMVGGVRPVAEAAIAPESGIWLYTEAHYSGASFVVSPKQPTKPYKKEPSVYSQERLSKQPNSLLLKSHQKNNISSLRVPPGVKVTLIDRAADTEHTYTAGNYRTLDSDIDDRADAVVVTAD